MAKGRKTSRKDNMRRAGSPASRKPGALIIALATLLAVGTIAAFVVKRSGNKPATNNANVASPNVNTPPVQSTTAPPNEQGKEPQTLTMDVNKAVMVTEELDFGGRPPSIAEALQQIERRYKPDDGQGRTFAVLDAYGEPTPDGKLLHISMHVSSEKPGMGELIFKRTGKVLWRSRILPTTLLTQPKNLTVLLDGGNGKTLTVDGSGNPASILDAKVKEMGAPVTAVWPDGLEREVTFIYSACGCPVKVMVKRVGDRTVRASELPVIFPDDPAAVEVIKRLMKW
jgi:hypothetical protein